MSNPFASPAVRALGALLCASLAALLPALSIAEWQEYSFDVMGTRAQLEIWEPDNDRAKQIAAQVEKEMRRIDALMSPYIESSELSAINRQPAGKKLSISAEIYSVIDVAQHIASDSDGVFDISYASVGHLYNYRENQRPSGDMLDVALQAVDYRSIVLHRAGDGERPAITLLRDGMKLDLGGIAKGYAVDRSVDILQRQGIAAGLVSAGGDSRVVGYRGLAESSQQIPWMIAVRHPRNEQKNALRLPLVDTAISTSGDYERYFFDGEERVHHIINTRTGLSASGVVSATVIGEQSMLCDALSTTVFALGVDAGLKFVEKFEGYDAVLIDAGGKLHFSSGLAPP